MFLDHGEKSVHGINSALKRVPEPTESFQEVYTRLGYTRTQTQLRQEEKMRSTAQDSWAATRRPHDAHVVGPCSLRACRYVGSLASLTAKRGRLVAGGARQQLARTHRGRVSLLPPSPPTTLMAHVVLLSFCRAKPGQRPSCVSVRPYAVCKCEAAKAFVNL